MKIKISALTEMMQVQCSMKLYDQAQKSFNQIQAIQNNNLKLLNLKFLKLIWFKNENTIRVE